MNFVQDKRIERAKQNARLHHGAKAIKLSIPGKWIVQNSTLSRKRNAVHHELEVTLEGRPAQCPCMFWTPYCWHFGLVRLSMERRAKLERDFRHQSGA